MGPERDARTRETEGALPPIGIEPVVSGGGIEGTVVDDGSGGSDCEVVGVAIKSIDRHCRAARRGVDDPAGRMNVPCASLSTTWRAGPGNPLLYANITLAFLSFCLFCLQAQLQTDYPR